MHHTSVSRVVALVRHGQTDWNAQRRLQGRADRPLNAVGLDQARRVAEDLASSEWDRVVTSPLLRARRTAQIIATRLGLTEPTCEAGLTEQGFGEAEGLEVAVAHGRWPDARFPGGEMLPEVDARVSSAWTRLCEGDEGARQIVVCHVVVVRSLARLLIDEDPGMVANGSALILREDAGRWRRLHDATAVPAQ